MPYKRTKLADDEIAVLKAWIDGGRASYSAGPLQDKGDAAEEWWSLKPLVKPAVPNVKLSSDASWVRTPVDQFILAKLAEKGLTPSPPADKRTLLRRVMFDLVGLPPTPEETAAFLADETPDAYEKLVDRLLASPQYGERWARHWMDIVHYAETHGNDQDRPRPNSWPYRDYLIRSRSMPITSRTPALWKNSLPATCSILTTPRRSWRWAFWLTGPWRRKFASATSAKTRSTARLAATSTGTTW